MHGTALVLFVLLGSSIPSSVMAAANPSGISAGPNQMRPDITLRSSPRSNAPRITAGPNTARPSIRLQGPARQSHTVSAGPNRGRPAIALRARGTPSGITVYTQTARPDQARTRPMTRRSAYRSHQRSQSASQDRFAQFCGQCRQNCVLSAGYLLRPCRRYPGLPYSAASCTAAINSCLARCERRYCSHDGR